MSNESESAHGNDKLFSMMEGKSGKGALQGMTDCMCLDGVTKEEEWEEM